jgi:hypothetical protein
MDVLALTESTTRLAGEGTALTIAASAAFCGTILSLIAAGSVKVWGERLGFIALAVSSLGAAIGFWRISSEVTAALFIFGALGAVVVLCALAAWDRLRPGPGRDLD